MTFERKSEPRGNEILRAISFISAILLFLHLAAIPIYLGFGVLVFGGGDGYVFLGRLLTFTALVSLAAFCLSTQFYLRSRRSVSSGQDE